VRISDVSPIYSPFVPWFERNPAPKPHPLCRRDTDPRARGLAYVCRA
jgi:hypothetical protein